jgi:hypothetical protein
MIGTMKLCRIAEVVRDAWETCKARVPWFRRPRDSQYSFLRFQLELHDPRGRLFGPNRTINTKHPEYAVLWHEYTHYLQNVATSIGVRIFLNWVGVLVIFGKNANRFPVLRIPMNRAPEYDFPKEWADFVEEHNSLAGTGGLDLTPPQAWLPYETYLDPSDGSHAFLCVEERGQKIGVPLRGKIFFEGMAQAVQWLAKGNGQWSDDFLKHASVAGTGAFYYALFKYFRHHTPDINPCIPVLCVSATALQTTQPAALFYCLHRRGMKGWNTEAQWLLFRQQASQLDAVKTGLSDTLARLYEFENDNVDKQNTQFMELALTLTAAMKTAVQREQNGPSLSTELLNPSPTSFANLCQKYGCPSIYTENTDNAFMFGATEKMNKWCSLNLAFYDLAVGLNNDGLTKPCPLLHTRICRHSKNRKTYCHRNRLQFPGEAQSTCPMGYAAQLLSLWRKPFVRIP